MTAYEAIVAALCERWATLEGLGERNAAGELIRVLDYEPSSIQDSMLVYVLLDRVDYEFVNRIDVSKYRNLSRFCFSLEESEFAEKALAPYVDAARVVIAQQPDLGKAQTLTLVTSAEAGYVQIGGTQYRALDIFTTTTVRSARGQL